MNKGLPKRYTSFEQVLTNCDDQVSVRRLLCDLVPPDIQLEVIKAFNKERRKRVFSREEWDTYKL